MKNLFITISLLILTSCASQPELKENSLSNREMKNIIITEDDLNKFNKPVSGVAESGIKGSDCSKLFSIAKSQRNWKSQVNAASSCFKNQDFSKVEELASDLSQKETSSPWGPYFHSLIAKERGDLERAQWMIELASRRAPDSPMILHLKGQILWLRKDYGASISAFEKAVLKDQSDLSAHLILGQVYFRDQEYSKASSHFETILQKDSLNKIALMGLAECQVIDKNFDGAIHSYSKLSKSDDTDGYYLTRLAEIYEIQKNQEQALTSYRLLKENMKLGKVKNNMDPEVDSKIRQLESTLAQRSVAGKKGSSK